MSVVLPVLVRAIALLFLAAATGLPVQAQQQAEVDSRFADVNGTRLHYLVVGQGEPAILLHGYTQTSHMWRPLIAELAKTHTVLAPDLRGAGQSAKPPQGYDKKTLAQDVHALASSLGYRRVQLVGHDIGLMVAYAYAAQYPAEVDRIALMDAFLPGVGNWQQVWLLRDLWHFHRPTRSDSPTTLRRHASIPQATVPAARASTWCRQPRMSARSGASAPRTWWGLG